MTQASGIVKEVTTKAWDNVTLYSIILEGDREYYRTGSIAPPCGRGDYIEFEFNQQGRNRHVDLNTLVKKENEVKAAPSPTVSSSSPATQASSGYGARRSSGGYAAKTAEKDAYWANKEQTDVERTAYQREVVEPRITLSAAQRDAITVVGLALQHEAIPFGNAAKGARLGIILESIDEVTARFVAQRTGKEVPEARKAVKKKAEAESFAEEVE